MQSWKQVGPHPRICGGVVYPCVSWSIDRLAQARLPVSSQLTPPVIVRDIEKPTNDRKGRSYPQLSLTPPRTSSQGIFHSFHLLPIVFAARRAGDVLSALYL